MCPPPWAVSPPPFFTVAVFSRQKPIACEMRWMQMQHVRAVKRKTSKATQRNSSLTFKSGEGEKWIKRRRSRA